jgi:hypothetical protein
VACVDCVFGIVERAPIVCGVADDCALWSPLHVVMIAFLGDLEACC